MAKLDFWLKSPDYIVESVKSFAEAGKQHEHCTDYLKALSLAETDEMTFLDMRM